jgi:hypothetical protein
MGMIDYGRHFDPNAMPRLGDVGSASRMRSDL